MRHHQRLGDNTRSPVLFQQSNKGDVAAIEADSASPTECSGMAAPGTSEKLGGSQPTQPKLTLAKGRGSAENDPFQTFAVVAEDQQPCPPIANILCSLDGVWHSARKAFSAEERPHKPMTWSMGAYLHPLADLVQDAMEHVKVGVAQPHPGISHVAGLYGLRRRAGCQEIMADHQVAIAAEHLVGSRIACNAPVTIRPQRNNAAGIAARGRIIGAMMADCQSPFAVKIELVADAVAIPLPDTWRPAANLRKLRALGPKESLHVSGRGANTERFNHLPPHFLDLRIGEGVHPVCGDNLR